MKLNSSEHRERNSQRCELAERTDAANAQRLLKKHGKDLRYVGRWKKWLTYHQGRWQLDDNHRAEHLAKTIGDDLFRDAADLMVLGDVTKSQKLGSFAKSSSNATGVEQMLKSARSLPDLAIGHEELDSHGWLLNLSNGTYDLEKDRFREHRREDHLTRKAQCKYVPDAECPLWDQFLERIFAGRKEVKAYLQQLVGLSLVGESLEHVLPICFGTGANGKSTFLNTLLYVFGEYGMQATQDLVMRQRYETHPTKLADLFGRRIACLIETGEMGQLNEAMVKALTGGERIRARRMKEDFWEFSPSHTLWMATNHHPRIQGTDDGIWRRVKLIPFEQQIPKSEQDPQLQRKLEAEAPGILNWALQGLRDWKAYGLMEPGCVKEQTAAYREQEDDLGQFLAEYCVEDPTAHVSVGRLYETYTKEWNGTLSQSSFARRIGERYRKERITHGAERGRKGVFGIGILTQG